MVERTAPDGRQSACLFDLGTVEYLRALEFQRELVRLRQEERIPDTLVLLEHPPVITLGRNADRRNLLVSDDELKRRGVSLYQVERGGDITFHGPGQLVGYPVFRIGSREWGMGNRERSRTTETQRHGESGQEARRSSGASGARSPDHLTTWSPEHLHQFVGVRRFVETMEQALILALAEFGIRAQTRPGFVGVWVSSPDPQTPEPSTPGTLLRKIASIGIAVKRGVVMHGFALNVTTDLAWFRLMNPCGLDGVRMTSVEHERVCATETQKHGGERSLMSDVRGAVVRGFEAAFGITLADSAGFDFPLLPR